MPVDRSWTVTEDEQHLPDVSVTEDGDLLLHPRVVHDDDPDSVMEALLEALAILRRVGGTIQIASQRGEIAPQIVVTESFIFAYNSFTPLVRRLAEQPQQPAFDQGDGADEQAEGPDALDGLTDEERAAHFPPMEDTAMGDAITQAAAEVPADEPERAAAAVE